MNGISVVFRKALAIPAVVVAGVFAASASGQGSEFNKIVVKDRVHLELPAAWFVYGAKGLDRLAQVSEQISGHRKRYPTSFAAQSEQTAPVAMARVTFSPADPPLTQAELKANAQEFADELRNELREGTAEMWARLAKTGVKPVGEPRVDVEELGGQLAIVVRYGRTQPGHPGMTMRVEQYWVPLGSEKAQITLSHLEGDPKAVASRDRIKRSIRVH